MFVKKLCQLAEVLADQGGRNNCICSYIHCTLRDTVSGVTPVGTDHAEPGDSDRKGDLRYTDTQKGTFFDRDGLLLFLGSRLPGFFTKKYAKKYR